MTKREQLTKITCRFRYVCALPRTVSRSRKWNAHQSQFELTMKQTVIPVDNVFQDLNGKPNLAGHYDGIRHCASLAVDEYVCS